MLIVQSSQDRAEEVVRWARNNKRVWKMLVRMLNASDLGNMIIGHGWMVYAIAMHHRGQGESQILHLKGMSESQVLAPFMQAQAGMNGTTANEQQPVNP